MPLRLTLALLLLGILPARADEAMLDRFLAAQGEVVNFVASFTQTRVVPTLDEPQVSPGRLWMGENGCFRMQTGDPPASIIVSDGEEVIGVRKTRLGYFRRGLDPEGAQVMPIRLMLGTGGGGGLRDDFTIVSSEEIENGIRQVVLHPTSAEIRRGVEALVLELADGGVRLHAFELHEQRGGRMRVEIGETEIVDAIPPEVFDPDWGLPKRSKRERGE